MSIPKKRTNKSVVRSYYQTVLVKHTDSVGFLRKVKKAKEAEAAGADFVGRRHGSKNPKADGSILMLLLQHQI